MYCSLSVVYDKLMDADYTAYKNIINQELKDKTNLLILDLGCGSGNLIDCLLKYGQVFAIDKSEEMLAQASSKNSNATYFCMDLLELDLLNKQFDFVVSAFDVFNYLENFLQFEEALKKVYNSLNIGGKFIFDIHTPKKINYLLNASPFAYEDEEISYIWFTYKTENELEVESEITFFIKEKEELYKKMYEFQKQRTYQIKKVAYLINNIGFKIKKTYFDFEENSIEEKEADRVIFVLEK